MKIKTYDVMIVGAGLIGLTMAAALSKTDLKVLVVDKSKSITPNFAAPHDLRVFAITPASRHFLSHLGVWEKIQKTSPYRQLCVWEKAQAGEIHFDARDVASAELGHIIENRELIRALLLSVSDRVELISPLQLQAIHVKDDCVRLQGDHACQFEGSLLVAADGGESWVRQQLNIPITSWDYDHHAIVATVQCEKPHAQTAWQHFMKSGPLALLPLCDPHLGSIVWSLDPSDAKRYMDMSNEAFGEAVSQGLEERLGNVTLESQRISFPLKMRHAKAYVQSRVALLGDSAHTIHPLAGLGANLGIYDAKALTDAIQVAISKHRDIGDSFILRRYQRERKGHNLLTIAMMEGFKRLFSHEDPWLQWARRWGLSQVNKRLMLKKFFIHQASGPG